MSPVSSTELMVDSKRFVSNIVKHYCNGIPTTCVFPQVRSPVRHTRREILSAKKCYTRTPIVARLAVESHASRTVKGGVSGPNIF